MAQPKGANEPFYLNALRWKRRHVARTLHQWLTSRFGNSLRPLPPEASASSHVRQIPRPVPDSGLFRAVSNAGNRTKIEATALAEKSPCRRSTRRGSRRGARAGRTGCRRAAR